MEKVKIKANVSNLLFALKNSFSNWHTTISELMQNSRRAGSTHIKITYEDGTLCVEDNGKVPVNFDALVSLAETGWEPDIVQSDSPYGIGFLSALFSAEVVEVLSHGKKAVIPTADAFAMEQINLESCDHMGGTIVKLHDFAADKGTSVFNKIGGVVKDYSIGFPLPVFFNGIEQERPFAVDDRFEYCEIGNILIDLDVIGFVVFLQGFLMHEFIEFKPHSYRRAKDNPEANIVHLDPQMFFGRVPDREVLVDHRENTKKIEEYCISLQRKALLKKKSEMDPLEFLNRFYKTVEKHGCLDIINDIPFLPVGTVHKIVDAPNKHESERYVGDTNDEVIPKEDIDSGKVRLFLDSHREEDVLGEMYIFLLGGFKICGHLHSEHWVYKNMMDVDKHDLDVVFKKDDGVVIDDAECDSYGVDGASSMTYCKEIIIKGPCGDVDTLDRSVYCESNGFFLQRDDTGKEYVLDQACDYRTEQSGDFYDEECRSEALTTFRAQLARIYKGVEEQVSTVIRDSDLCYIKELAGKTLKLVFSKGSAREFAVRILNE